MTEQRVELTADTTAYWRTRALQLQGALDTRVIIEQAKGVLAERYRLDVNQAFDLLRRAARAHRVTVQVLALDVVRSERTPEEIVTMLRTRGSVD